MTKLVDLHKRD